MKIGVYARRMAEDKGYMNQEINEPYIWISIQSSDNTIQPKPIRFSKLWRDTLFMMFDDIEHELEGRHEILFTQERAARILEFVLKHKDSVGMICVHCDAGISRSAGVAAALALWINGTEDGTIDHRYHHPNALVKSLMLREIRKYEAAENGSSVCGGC